MKFLWLFFFFAVFFTLLFILGRYISRTGEERRDRERKKNYDGVLKALRKDKMLSHDPNSEVDVHPKYWQSFKNLNNVN